jgi:hypothetical protein
MERKKQKYQKFIPPLLESNKFAFLLLNPCIFQIFVVPLQREMFGFCPKTKIYLFGKNPI